MSKRYKMTVDISEKLHEELRQSASLSNMGLSAYVNHWLSEDLKWMKDKQKQVERLIRRIVKIENGLVIWRALAIAFFVGMVLCIALLNKLNKDYINLFNEGVPVSEDVSMVQYYKAIISNKCKIEAR